MLNSIAHKELHIHGCGFLKNQDLRSVEDEGFVCCLYIFGFQRITGTIFGAGTLEYRHFVSQRNVLN